LPPSFLCEKYYSVFMAAIKGGGVYEMREFFDPGWRMYYFVDVFLITIDSLGLDR